MLRHCNLRIRPRHCRGGPPPTSRVNKLAKTQEACRIQFVSPLFELVPFSQWQQESHYVFDSDWDVRHDVRHWDGKRENLNPLTPGRASPNANAVRSAEIIQ